VTVAGRREIEQTLEHHYGLADGEELDMEFEDEGPMQITDISGQAVVTEPAPPPPPKVRRRPSAPPPPALLSGLSEEDRRLVLALQQGLDKSASALQVVLDLCVEKGLVSLEDIVARIGKH
jgi:hypothetical protein